MFGRLTRALGGSGVGVETTLATTAVAPGGVVHGTVVLTTEDHDAQIQEVVLSLATRMEVERGDEEFVTTLDLSSVRAAGAGTLDPRARVELPFALPVPWETPLTHVYGQPLRGMTMGVRTDVAIASALDKGDLDPVAVMPLPAQQAFLDAMARSGFGFRRADVENGHVRGTRQRLPAYQEIEFGPAPWARRVNEVEVTFVADEHGMDIVLEVDKRGGFFTEGRDAFGYLSTTHADAVHTDWEAQLHQLLG